MENRDGQAKDKAVNAGELVHEFQKLVLAEAGITACWAENTKPLTAEQLERIGKRAERLFRCQHNIQDFDFQRGAYQCGECGVWLEAEHPEDSGFAALEQERK